MSTIAPPLASAADSLEEAVSWVLAHYQSDAQLPGAVAVDFLMTGGTLVGGWSMARAALVAKAKLTEDENFYSAKLITARFYAEQVMPRVAAYVQAAQSGSEMTMALADDQF